MARKAYIPTAQEIDALYNRAMEGDANARDQLGELNNSISNSNRDLNVLINKGETSSLKDISYNRIKTGKPSNSIKSIINRTLGGNNNTIIFSNMANDFNNKFLKGIEKKPINGNKKTK